MMGVRNLGNFYIDENRTFMGGLWQGISRYTWEHPQTVLGNDLSQLRNIFGQVDRVEYLGGATFSINEKSNVNYQPYLWWGKGFGL